MKNIYRHLPILITLFGWTTSVWITPLWSREGPEGGIESPWGGERKSILPINLPKKKKYSQVRLGFERKPWKVHWSPLYKDAPSPFNLSSKIQASPCRLLNLPLELLYEVFSTLNKEDFLSLRRLNHGWKNWIDTCVDRHLFSPASKKILMYEKNPFSLSTLEFFALLFRYERLKIFKLQGNTAQACQFLIRILKDPHPALSNNAFMACQAWRCLKNDPLLTSKKAPESLWVQSKIESLFKEFYQEVYASNSALPLEEPSLLKKEALLAYLYLSQVDHYKTKKLFLFKKDPKEGNSLYQSPRFHQLSQRISEERALLEIGKVSPPSLDFSYHICMEDKTLSFSKKNHYLTLLSSKGHLAATKSLARLYEKENPIWAFHFRAKAAQEGDKKSQRLLGHFYKRKGILSKDKGEDKERSETKREEREKNDQEAARWYEKAAGQKDVKAQRELGKCYGQGRGVLPDHGKAFSLFLQAALQGDSDSHWRVGIYYLEGLGIPKNEDLAFLHFNQAAEWDNKIGYFYKGRCYERGWGTGKNEKKALKNYLKSAHLGYPRGKRVVGDFYMTGQGGLEQNEEHAYGAYNEAGLKDTKARLSLAYHYWRGMRHPSYADTLLTPVPLSIRKEWLGEWEERQKIRVKKWEKREKREETLSSKNKKRKKKGTYSPPNPSLDPDPTVWMLGLYSIFLINQ
jgi:TPR repeat protein